MLSRARAQIELVLHRKRIMYLRIIDIDFVIFLREITPRYKITTKVKIWKNLNISWKNQKISLYLKPEVQG